MPDLFEYGITTIQADVWVHVCPSSFAVYWYRRTMMLKAIGRGRYEQRTIVSARGYLVPVSEWLNFRHSPPSRAPLAGSRDEA